jgi:hypothetical protein
VTTTPQRPARRRLLVLLCAAVAGVLLAGGAYLGLLGKRPADEDVDTAAAQALLGEWELVRPEGEEGARDPPWSFQVDPDNSSRLCLVRRFRMPNGAVGDRQFVAGLRGEGYVPDPAERGVYVVTVYSGIVVKEDRLECLGRDGKQHLLHFRLKGDDLELDHNGVTIAYRRKR